MIKEVLLFLKNPVYVPYSDKSIPEKKTVFTQLLVLNLAFSFCLGLLMGLITTLVNPDLGSHGVDELFKEYPFYIVFILAVILAPVIEELIFRGPLVFFKKSRFFNYIFYISAVLFGIVHLSNFESFHEFLWLTPVLVAPQVFAGFFLGFARVKLGLGWSMLLHACHNGILLTPFLLVKLIGETTH